jgi:hypothetical protein
MYQDEVSFAPLLLSITKLRAVGLLLELPELEEPELPELEEPELLDPEEPELPEPELPEPLEPELPHAARTWSR